MAKPLPTRDLAHVLEQAEASLMALREANLFITGGTGFFGHWLLESLLYANDAVELNLRVTVLTRNADGFRERAPHLARHVAVTVLEGDIASFPFPETPHTHVLHAATDSGGQQTSVAAGDLCRSIVAGSERVLAFAKRTGAGRLLYISTGAVYGRSTTLTHTPESYLETHAPELPKDSYESGKLIAERIVAASASSSFTPAIARCFAFTGPHLPLDQHFVIGNFIGAALADKPIVIHGDGTPRRAWMYMADLAVWLWTMLAHGEAGRAYNVGSDEAMTIAEAAERTAEVLRPGLPIEVLGRPAADAPLNSYVPDIERARRELGLTVTVPFDEAVRRTAAWYREEISARRTTRRREDPPWPLPRTR